ncbi:MAG: SDR family oxidoreductase [Spirochaetes bacterium]|nr:SDR family oxidoreductase [Spirochaetota bacterium]
MARHLARRGWNLILHYHSSREEVEAVQRDAEALGRKVHLLQRDLAGEHGARGLVAEAHERLPGLRLLVNNASVFTKGDLGDIDHLEAMVRIHGLAVARLSSDFHRLAGGGQVVNLIDAQLRSYAPAFQNYRISKLFLEELTRQSALRFAPSVRVNAIAPGPILPAEGDNGERFEETVARTPLKKAPGLDSILRCLDILLDNEFLTGQVLYADSGQHL